MTTRIQQLDIWENWLTSLPFPLAFVLKDSVIEAPDDERRVRGIIKTFTVGIQYVALICAAEYVRTDYLDRKLSWHLDRLKRPLISDLFAFVTASVLSFSEHGLTPLVNELPDFSVEMEQTRVEVPVLVDNKPVIQSLLLRRALVELRNSLAHRAFHPNWATLLDEYLPLLELFLTSLQWSTRYPLFRVGNGGISTCLMGTQLSVKNGSLPASLTAYAESRPAGGTDRLFIGNEAMSQVLDLYPFMVMASCDQCLADPSRGLREEIFLYNGDHGRFLDYLGVRHSLNITDPKPVMDTIYASKKTVPPTTKIGQINFGELAARAKDQSKQLLMLNIESRRYLPQVYQSRKATEIALNHFLESTKVGLLLTGDSGIGKTTLLCRLAESWSDPQNQMRDDEPKNILLFYQGKGLFAQGLLEDRIIRDLYLQGDFIDLINRLIPTELRIVLIVDGVNEDDEPSKTLLALSQFITRYGRMVPLETKRTPLKVIFSFRTAFFHKTLRALGLSGNGDENEALFPLDVFMSSQSASPGTKTASYQFNVEQMDQTEAGELYERYRSFSGILDKVTGKTRRFCPITPFASLSKQTRQVLAHPWYLRMALESFNARSLPTSLWEGKLLRAFCETKIYGRNTNEQELLIDRAKFVEEVVRLMRNERKDSIERGDLLANPKLAYAVMELQLGISPFLQLIDEGVLMEVGQTQIQGRRRQTRLLVRFAFDSVLEYLLSQEILREAHGLRKLSGADIASLLGEAKDFEPILGAVRIVLTEAAERKRFQLLIDSLSTADQWTLAPIIVDVLSVLENQADRNFEPLLDALEKSQTEEAQTVLVQASYYFGERRKARPMLACAKRAYNMGPELLLRLRRSDILDGWTTAIMNLANALRLLGRIEEAEDFYRKAIEIGKSQLESNPSKETSHGLAMAHFNRGTLLLDKGALLLALECLRNAEDIFRELPKDFKNVRLQLIGTIVHRSRALALLDRTSEALASCEEAVSLARAETQSELPGSHRTLATALMAQGSLFLQLGRNAEAVRDLEEAVRILETQEEDFDANTIELAPVLSHLGMALTEVGSFSRSVESFDKALAIHRESMNQDDVWYTRLARLLMNKGTALDKAGQVLNAADCYDEGIDTWQLAIDQSTSRFHAARDNERLSVAMVVSEEINGLLKGMTMRFDLFRRSENWARAAVEIEKLLGLFVEYKTESVAKGLTRFFTELRDMSPLERENLYAALGEKEEIFRGIIESKSISFEFVDEDE